MQNWLDNTKKSFKIDRNDKNLNKKIPWNGNNDLIFSISKRLASRVFVEGMFWASAQTLYYKYSVAYRIFSFHWQTSSRYE